MDRMSSGLEMAQGCSFGSETVDNHGGNLCFLESLGASGGKVARVATWLRRFGASFHDCILSRLVGCVCVCGLFVTLPLLITQAVMLLMDQKIGKKSKSPPSIKAAFIRSDLAQK